MTRERVLLLSLDEISRLRFQCNKCKASTLYELDQTIRLPQTCSSCGDPFIDPSALSELHQIQAFASALKAAVRAQKRVNASLKLELIDHG